MKDERRSRVAWDSGFDAAQPCWQRAEDGMRASILDHTVLDHAEGVYPK